MSNQLTVSMLNVGAANEKPFEFGVGLDSDMILKMSAIAKTTWNSPQIYESVIENLPNNIAYDGDYSEGKKNILRNKDTMFEMSSDKGPAGGRYGSSKEKGVGKKGSLVFSNGSPADAMLRLSTIAGKINENLKDKDEGYNKSDEEVITEFVINIDKYLKNKDSGYSVFLADCTSVTSTHHNKLAEKQDSGEAERFFTEGIFVYTVYCLLIVYKYLEAGNSIGQTQSDDKDIDSEKKKRLAIINRESDVLLLNETSIKLSTGLNIKATGRNTANEGPEEEDLSLSHIITNKDIVTDGSQNIGNTINGMTTVSEAAYVNIKEPNVHIFCIHMNSEDDKDERVIEVTEIIKTIKNHFNKGEKYVISIDTNSSNLTEEHIKKIENSLNVFPVVFFKKGDELRNKNYTTNKIRTYMQSQLKRAGIPGKPGDGVAELDNIDKTTKDVFVTNCNIKIEDSGVYTMAVQDSGLKMVKLDYQTDPTIPNVNYPFDHYAVKIRIDLGPDEYQYQTSEFDWPKPKKEEEQEFGFHPKAEDPEDPEVKKFGFKGNTNNPGFSVNPDGSISVGGGKRRKSKRRTKSKKTKMMKKKSSRKSRAKKAKKSKQMNNAMMNNKSFKKQRKGKKRSKKY